MNQCFDVAVTSTSQLNNSEIAMNTSIWNRATCLSSISNFLDNFFKASLSKTNLNESK